MGLSRKEKPGVGDPSERDRLSSPNPAAIRALAEAAERRAKPAPARPREIGGREGPEPTRYGDWENKGLASDF